MAVKDSDMERSLTSPDGGSERDSLVSSKRESDKEHKKRALSNCQRLSYGVGHVLNDLTASMWFSYLLVFLHQVNKFENMLAGHLMNIGQISDALFTPFIGYESDRTSGIFKLGKRKSWHIVGTLCVMVSFPFLFTKCITCSHAPSIAQFVYYAPFVVIFQFGWAATQISHLSFSSDFSPYKHERVTLQSIRNAFTVVANLSVYGVFVLLFYLDGKTENDDDLGPQDAPKFQNLAFISIGLGTLFNLMFYCGTRERKAKTDTEKGRVDGVKVGDCSIEQSTIQHLKMAWRDWLKEPQFYQIALLYMATRLYINVSQVYFPMYLTETVGLEKSSIAILPLVSYCSSFLSSFATSFINNVFGRKASYTLGVAIGAGSCVWMYLIGHNDNQVYGAAVLMGAAGSLLLITSLSMTSDLIAANIESGAFVFGAMSFTDKLSSGIAVELIQTFHPCVGCCPACEPYYRHVLCFIPGGALVVGFIALLSLLPQNIGSRTRRTSVLKVLSNPVSSSDPLASSLTDSLQCPCGLFYTPPSACSDCGLPPVYPANGAITHCAEIHRNTESCEEDEDDADREIEPLLNRGHNINTPQRDIGLYTENGSVPQPATATT